MSGRGEVGAGGVGLATVLTGLKNFTLVPDWLLRGFLCEGACWSSELFLCCLGKLVPIGAPGGALDFLALSQNC